MASSQIQTGDEIAVGESAESINTVTVDDVFTASAYGDLEKLRKFVEQDGASLSLPDIDGHYALHFAAMNNSPEIAQYIIEHGGDVNAATDKAQRTPLHCAAVEGWISVADVLLQNGAQVEAVDVEGLRAAHIAAYYGKTSFLNHIVAKHNADFDVADNYGMSPLHWAAFMGFVDTVKLLLSRDASQKRQDKKGRTPLHLAVEQDNLEVCTVLIDAGTKQEIMVKDDEGYTPIQLASAISQTRGELLLVKALRAECKHLENSNFKEKALQKERMGGGTATNWPMIIAMQGDAYTGKSLLARHLAERLKCPIISLDDFLDASEPTGERDELISHTFNVIAQIVKTQISLGLSSSHSCVPCRDVGAFLRELL